jgi:hypothetical protein
MTAQTKAILKGYYNHGDKPSESNYADLIDTIPSGAGTLVVAANDAPSTITARADYVCDGTDDHVQIQSAIDALTGGGVVQLSTGTFTLGGTVTLGANVRLVGQGRSTIITSIATASLLVMALGGGAEHLSVSIPNGLLDHAIKSHAVYDISANMRHGWYLSDLLIYGGNSADKYALDITDTFDFLLQNLVIRVGSNGVRIANENGTYNYGNALINLVEVSVGSNRVAWDIDGTAQTKFFNLMTFNYISGVSGSSVGNIGLRIRNCGFMVFNGIDLEGCGTSLYLEGGINGGMGANSNTFNGIYASNNVQIKAGSYSNVFMGGKIFGTVTDEVTTTKKKTRWIGTVNASNEQIVDNANGV